MTLPPRTVDICGWCGKKIKSPDEVAWRGMKSKEGIHAAANYCPPSKAQKLDPSKTARSECEILGSRNLNKVVDRLLAYKAKLLAARAAKQEQPGADWGLVQ